MPLLQRQRGASRARLPSAIPTPPARGWSFAEKALAVLGTVGVAWLSGDIGAALESVKTANAEALEITKRRIDKSSEVFERLETIAADANHAQLDLTMGLKRWEEVNGQDEMDAARHLNEIVAAVGQKHPLAEIGVVYDPWIAPTLRAPLDRFAKAVLTYYIAVTMRWPFCVHKRWSDALLVAGPGTTMHLPSYQDKVDWDRECLETLFPTVMITDLPKARRAYQDQLDAFVKTATTSPSLFEQLFGAAKDPVPERRPSEELEETWERMQVEAGPWTPPAASARAARQAAENLDVVRGVLAQDEPELPDSGLLYDQDPNASIAQTPP